MNGALILFSRLFLICFVAQLAKASTPTDVTFLNDQDFKRGKAFNRDHGVVIDQSATQYSSLTEDDIIEPVLPDGRVKRNAAINRQWTNKEIPYAMDTTFSEDDRVQIAAAMQEIQDKTCIRFVNKTSAHNDYAHLKNNATCGAVVGRKGGEQHVNIGGPCAKKEVILHELLHTIGFVHEHMRPDRDEYVTVVEGKIKKDYKRHFTKMNDTLIDTLGTPYDYGSIMHYHATAFSKDGQPTIKMEGTKGKVPKGVVVGQRVALSALDVLRINVWYNCTDELCEKNPTEDSKVTLWTGGLVVIEKNPPLPSELNAQLAAATLEIMQKTCIQFVAPDELESSYPKISYPRNDHIQFRDSGGCGSDIGKKGGLQTMFLGRPECQTKGSILHYLMHAIGFDHETARSDRDNFVKVNESNVHDSCKGNLKKKESPIKNTETQYDYGSIMHPSLNAGSKNGGATITLKTVQPGVTVGQRDELSDMDVQRIKKLYPCIPVNRAG